MDDLELEIDDQSQSSWNDQKDYLHILPPSMLVPLLPHFHTSSPTPVSPYSTLEADRHHVQTPSQRDRDTRNSLVCQFPDHSNSSLETHRGIQTRPSHSNHSPLQQKQPRPRSWSCASSSVASAQPSPKILKDSPVPRALHSLKTAADARPLWTCTGVVPD